MCCVVCAAGLTERQALALALEESRRAALAVKHSMQVCDCDRDCDSWTLARVEEELFDLSMPWTPLFSGGVQ